MEVRTDRQIITGLGRSLYRQAGYEWHELHSRKQTMSNGIQLIEFAKLSYPIPG